MPEPHVVELRQYELVPGRRDTLIDLFEREFVESQEALGIHLVGTFVDLDNPDRFVWMRAFANHAVRNEALPGFYYGPAWKAHRDEANATMVDSDNVLLLRSTSAGPAFPIGPDGPVPVTPAPAPAMYAISVYAVPSADAEAGAINLFRSQVLPLATDAGAETVALLRTDPAVNGFPALPVRADEHVLVWMRRFADVESHARPTERLTQSPAWQSTVAPALAASVGEPIQQLRLTPTDRSRLR